MELTDTPYFTLPKYKAGHDLKTAQEVPPFELGTEMRFFNPASEMYFTEPVPVKDSHHGLWLNLAKRHAEEKRREFQEDYVKCHCFWPDGTENWVTVDAGGWEKVW